ncbi:hypothetical protein MKX08_009233 [Trichoderma sp. CBMAI-0020]|nr:hypothetical protein MKX08_009233 [Trichoderma sp. CBMAI-0020]
MPTTATSIRNQQHIQQSTRNAARDSVAGGATQSTCENPAVLVLTWVLVDDCSNTYRQDM